MLGNIYFMEELKASLKDKREAEKKKRFLFPLTNIKCCILYSNTQKH